MELRMESIEMPQTLDYATPEPRKKRSRPWADVLSISSLVFAYTAWQMAASPGVRPEVEQLLIAAVLTLISLFLLLVATRRLIRLSQNAGTVGLLMPHYGCLAMAGFLIISAVWNLILDLS